MSDSITTFNNVSSMTKDSYAENDCMHGSLLGMTKNTVDDMNEEEGNNEDNYAENDCLHGSLLGMTTKTVDDMNEEEDTNEDHGSLLGMTTKTMDDMYELYCKHARSLGFSVRKSTSKYSKDGTETSKLFVCSCSGLRRSTSNSSSLDGAKRKNIGITRTDCMARMRAKRTSDGGFEVVKHVEEHNHTLTRPEWSHLHRSERRITSEKAQAIEDMTSSGMKATESFRYLAHNVGGEEYVGHTIIDHMNFVNRSKRKKIEGGDTETLLDMIQDKEENEADFFFKVKIDDEGRLASIFWRDSMMKEDYDIYGDVVVFDTTYRTNRYNLICAPIVGVNNHWKNVMFGCAFISDEKTNTFEWLFKVFKKSMCGKSPITIFTDQDLAIANAIEKVFPETSHRLCLWHLNQNVGSRFGRLKSDNTFKNIFNKCLSGCANELEFESCWKKMIADYNLESNSWFTRLYGLRNKWCTALNKVYFSAGIRSSQRSESTNHAIGFTADMNTSLTDFFEIFNSTIKRWRRAEQQDEFNCSRSCPQSWFENAGMVKHASEVYTLSLFDDFQKQFMKGISASSSVIGEHDTKIVYSVTSHKGNSSNEVIFDNSLNLITCDCKYFEEFGMLCHHSLIVLLINSVQRIPEAYIKKRWTKMAKSQVWDKFRNEANNTEQCGKSIPWRHEMTRKLYNLVLKSEESDEGKIIVEELYKKGTLAIDELNSAKMMDTSIDSESSRTILDPACSITKGRGKRIKGHYERSKKNNLGMSTSAGSKEFGSKTPNPHLI